MALPLNSLSIHDIRTAVEAGEAAQLNDGGGLYFRIRVGKRKSGDSVPRRGEWLYRYKIAGRGRWMTLGYYPGNPTGK